MIYLDYAANTPVDIKVMESFCEATQGYVGNPNSSHPLGQAAKKRMDEAIEQIADLMKVQGSEVILTSGASESNNLAIKGITNKNKRYGRHIITTYLEHSSVTNTVAALKQEGYEIDFVDITEDGLVDLEHLEELLREDTVLVSISYVDSELGIKQPIDAIGRLIAEYPQCAFHVDATQAVGKIPLQLEWADLISFAPHKFYGLNGCGVLIKKEKVMIEPLIHGGHSTTSYRSGTPMLALAVSTGKAMEIAFAEINERYSHVEILNQKLRVGLSRYKEVHINSTDEAIPFILNISLRGINAGAMQEALAEHEIYVSTKSACCVVNTPSRPVYALTKDRKLALSTLRMSLSHLNTMEEIEAFLKCFDECYKKLGK